jgi:protein-S-isoprenylcysteine O-methyltransferase Ste14
MQFAGIFVIISFSLFDILYLLRTILMRSMEIQVWAMRKNTNNTLERVVEAAAMPLVLVYDFFLFLKAVNIHVHPIVSQNILTIPRLEYLGFASCALSLVLLALVLTAIFTATDEPIRKYTLDGLIVNGIYRYTRNPVFIAIDLYVIGIALIYPTVGGIASVLLACMGVHVHVLAEEKYLLSRCGAQYTAYMKRTKRYIV